MKKLHLNLMLGLTAICLSTLSSCEFDCVKGSGHQVSETNKVADFNKIKISGDFVVNLKQDSSLNVTLTADDNLLKYIKTEVDDNTLEIKTRRSICSGGRFVINIGIRNLEKLASSGAVEIDGDGKITTGDLDIDLSGASKVNLNLNAANVTTRGSGATELDLTGQASSHHVKMSGVGKVYAYDFVVGDYEISTTGAGDCQINVLHSLRVHSTGASDVKYKGNPSDVTSDKLGAASLEKVN